MRLLGGSSAYRTTPVTLERCPLNLIELLRTLGAPEAVDLFANHWEESEACFPAHRPRFLQPAVLCDARALGGLDAAANAPLDAAAERVAASPELSHLAWHAHRLLFEHPEYEATRIGQWPLLIACLGDWAGAFYLLIALDAVPRMRAVHQRLGIPDEVSRATCLHYREPVRVYMDHHDGHYGLLPGNLYWWRNHVRGDLYRLGRLEYMRKPFHGCVQAFRHRRTRDVVALAVTGTEFDAEGLVAGGTREAAWSARLEQRADAWAGTPVPPHGRALQCQVVLCTRTWEPALQPGDPVLEVHIPAGGGMTLARCHHSMSWAARFFSRHLPDATAVGFACYSWILNPDLARIYRPDGNLVQWQRQLYLFPVPCGDRSGLNFVFGTEPTDLCAAPRDTSLRRALLDHLLAGGRLAAGGMFLLDEEFERFGAQVYRNRWDRTALSLEAE